MVGYVTGLLFFFFLWRTPSPVGEQFMWILRNDRICETQATLFFLMCLLRTILYLCPNMIHFDAVDFSECRSEEVMFLLTLSVYFMLLLRLYCKSVTPPMLLQLLILLLTLYTDTAIQLTQFFVWYQCMVYRLKNIKCCMYPFLTWDVRIRAT